MATVSSQSLHVVGAAIVREAQVGAGLPSRQCLVAQRGATMSNPLLWEFPGGKVEAGEAPQVALQREILEELGIEVAVDAWLGRSTFEVGEGRESRDGDAEALRVIALDVYLCRWLGGQIELAEHLAWRWVTADEIPSLDWSPADRPLLDDLETVLRR